MCRGKLLAAEISCNCTGIKLVKIECQKCPPRRSSVHSTSTIISANAMNTGLAEITTCHESGHNSAYSIRRHISRVRTKPSLEKIATKYSVLSRHNNEVDTTASSPTSTNCAVQCKSKPFTNHPSNTSENIHQRSNSKRNLQAIIPSPILDENLHTEAEYAVRQDRTRNIVIERIEDDQPDYYHIAPHLPLDLLDSDSSTSNSVVSLDSILLEENDYSDIGPEAIVICDDSRSSSPQFNEDVTFRERPVVYPRSHSMSDIYRRIHVLDELLFSIDLEYGASDIGPQSEVLFENLADNPVTNAGMRHLIHRSSDSEVIIDSMFAAKKKHSCCKTRRKLSWNSGKRRKSAAQLNLVPHHRPRKIVVVGDMCSGKSSLISAYCKDRFNETYVPTILRSCITDAILHGEKVELVVIEVSGREDYFKLRKCAYRKADAVVLCYSCDNPSSLEKIRTYWLPELQENVPNAPCILVGTKKDIRDEILGHDQLEGISPEERIHRIKSESEKFVVERVGYEISEAIGAHCFLECSAKYRDGTRNVFESVAKVAMKKSRRKRKVQRTGDVCGIM